MTANPIDILSILLLCWTGIGAIAFLPVLYSLDNKQYLNEPIPVVKTALIILVCGLIAWIITSLVLFAWLLELGIDKEGTH